MQIMPELKSCKGTILIVTLWILIVLTVFALALGRRASLEIKLAEYQRDELRAAQLSGAAIERAIWEKRNDIIGELDALSESWANNEAAFEDFALGQGTFTVSYLFDRMGEEEDFTLYGMEDEESKININKVEEQVLLNLLESCGVEDAERMASSIFIWSGKKEDTGDEEEAYYQALSLPYHCKKEEFKSISELLLVRGITTQLLYGEDEDGDGRISKDEKGIVQYLTVFGEGSVNINTAGKKVLNALIGDAFPDLADKIALYRKGDDGEPGSDDDGWFSIDADKVELGAGGTKEVKKLTAHYSEVEGDIFFDVTEEEWGKLQSLQSVDRLSATSNTFTIYAQAEVKKVKKSIVATIDLSESEQISYHFWHKN